MGITIEPLLWEGGGPTNPNVEAFPSRMIGEGPQAVIDQRIWDELGGYDVYVGMIWHRMGTPVGEWRSGTEAEYHSARRWREKVGMPSTILFYEKDAAVRPQDIDHRQLEMVQSFTQTLQSEGLLQRFADEQSLRRLLIPDLTDAVNRMRKDVASAGRLVLLEELERESRARCVMRWQGAGLSRTEARIFAEDPDVGALQPALRAKLDRPLVLLTAEVGAGKSLLAERLLQEAIVRSREDGDAPVPVYLQAKQAQGRLRVAVEDEIEGLGSLRHQGARVFVDGAEGVGFLRATSLLDEARILIETWPKVSVMITSQPVPGLSSAEEAILMPELSESEAHEIVSIVSGLRITPMLIHGWPDPVRDAIRRPLFAVLLGVYERERDHDTPRSKGDLLSNLATRALLRSGPDVDLEEVQRLAAMTVDRGGGLVPGAEVAGGDNLRRLESSGLVVEVSGALGFPLPILAHWFAAQSLASGYPRSEDIAGDEQRLELWRYPLTIAVNRLGSGVSTALFGPLAEKHPGFVSEVVNEGTARWGGLSEVVPPPALLECGRQLRDAMGAWAKGLGPLARLIAPLRKDGTVATVGIDDTSPMLDVSWYRGEDGLDDVVRLPLEVVRSPNPNWPRVRGARPGREPAWAWRWTLEELRAELSKLMRKRRLPIDGGPLALEAAWQAGAFLSGRGSLYSGAIPLTVLESRLASIRKGVNVVHGVGGQRHDVRYLREEIERLRKAGAVSLDAPWPGPNLDLSDGSRTSMYVWEPYSDSRILARATAVYTGALDGYRQLVDAWFSRLKTRMNLAAALPVCIRGVIWRREDEDSNSQPIISMYVETLPTGSEDSVDLAWGSGPLDWEYVRSEQKRARSVRPGTSARISDMGGHSLLEIFRGYPATDLVYEWLWRDLQRISWVDGGFTR